MEGSDQLPHLCSLVRILNVFSCRIFGWQPMKEYKQRKLRSACAVQADLSYSCLHGLKQHFSRNARNLCLNASLMDDTIKFCCTRRRCSRIKDISFHLESDMNQESNRIKSPFYTSQFKDFLTNRLLYSGHSLFQSPRIM